MNWILVVYIISYSGSYSGVPQPSVVMQAFGSSKACEHVAKGLNAWGDQIKKDRGGFRAGSIQAKCVSGTK